MFLLHSLLLEIFDWLSDGITYLKRRKITSAEKAILENKFIYYQRLNQGHKDEFVKKLELVLTSKLFIGRGNISVVNSEMKILIGATIVMVTFGWNDIRLAHFNKILIYPDTYYSTISKQYHRGEVNPKQGIVVLSWNCFLNGLEDQKDGINLGIHEIAHALKLENQIYYNGESEFFNPEAWNAYQQWVSPEMVKIAAGNGSFLRESASLNEHEFFAVALENFFERPKAFFEYHPALYGALVQLLRQDPRVWMS